MHKLKKYILIGLCLIGLGFGLTSNAYVQVQYPNSLKTINGITLIGPGNIVLGGGTGSVTQVNTSGSITGGPITTTGTLSLTNDSATPGNSKYYGTNGTGTKGFFTIPVLSEVDPVFGAWLSSPPNVSIFTNDSGYITSGALTGYVPYTGATTNLDLGIYTATSANFISTVAIGTQPYATTSTTLNTNLNADLLDGQHGAYYAPASSLYWSRTGTDLYPLNTGDAIAGTTTASGNLTLKSTTHATKGKILFGTSAYDEVNNRLGIGNAVPAQALDITGNGQFSLRTYIPGTSGTSGQGYFTGTSAVPLGAFQSLNAGGKTYSFLATNKFYTGSGWADSGQARVGSSFQMIDDSFIFYTFDTANAFTARMGITTTTGSFFADGNTFNVDAVNHRVGIGTTTPTEKLNIRQGAIDFTKSTDPASAMTLGQSAGAGPTYVTAGLHSYAVRFYMADGTITGTGGFFTNITVVGATQQVNITNIPVSPDANVVGRKIYRTLAGSNNGFYNLVATIANNTATTYTDIVADAGVAYQFYQSAGAKNTTAGDYKINSVSNMSFQENLTTFGYEAGLNNLMLGNSVFGYQAFHTSPYVSEASVFGYQAGFLGNSNGLAAFGYKASYSGGGAGTTVFGARGFMNLTTGAYNVAVGYSAGYLPLSVAANATTTGNYNTFLGAFSGQASATQRDYLVAIGVNAVGNESNLMVLGGTGSNATRVTIGGTTAYGNLDVWQPTTGIGTVSNSAGGTTVTGVSTWFLNTFKVGDTITINGETKAISAIASNTSMTTAAFTGANSGVAYTLTGGNRLKVLGNGYTGFNLGTAAPLANLDVLGTARFGDHTTNYSSFEADGTYVMTGNATVFTDLLITPTAFDLVGATAPKLVSYQPTGAGIATMLYEFRKDDIAYFTVQLPHGYKEGSNIGCHLHWTPGLRGTAEGTATVGWKVQYSWANIDGTFTAMATADLSDATQSTNDQHLMTPVVSISGAGKTISSMLIAQVTRTDTGADDTWATNTTGNLPMLLTVDFHIEMDTIGSRTNSAK